MDAQAYIAQAIAQSYDNRPDVLTQEQPELLAQLQLYFRGYYRIGAKENPGAMSARVVLTWDTNGWNIPAIIDTTIRLERQDSGVEVITVPLNDRGADPSVGAVYRLGRRYIPAGNANDPSNVNLLAYYSSVGPDFSALSDEPGDEWPNQFDPMVIAELAAFMAAKDSRSDDANRLQGIADGWKADFTRWLQTPDLNIRRRFGAPAVIPTPAVRPVGVNR